VAALDARSVAATRLAAAARERADGADLVAEFRGLVEAQRDAGSTLAARLLAERHELESDVWLVEPIAGPAVVEAPVVARPAVHVRPASPVEAAAPG
jgi:hypothetical protein